MTLLPRAARAALLGALCAPLLVAAVPAVAMAPAAACHTSGGGTSVRGRLDTPRLSVRDLRALPASHTTRRYLARHVRLAHRVVVPVAAHVVQGTAPGDRAGVSTRRLERAIRVLNRAMAGRESRASATTRFRFRLASVDRTRREGWYHAFFDGPRDRRMKRALHVGGPGTLNLYVNDGGPSAEPVLGWSRFPWQYAATPRLDGVSVNRASLPGGRASGYDEGDTLVHETGHWLGLLHTFEGGCASPGDLVRDTPPEAWPDRSCTRDPAVPLGLDPAHNFMDYASDDCMDSWTPGQVRRMDAAFATWRLRDQ